MTKKLKIYFLQPTVVGSALKTQSDNNGSNLQQVYINPTPLYLDSYISLQDPVLHQNIEWTTFQFKNISQPELLKDLENHNIDILCVSVYVWNCKATLKILKNIKEKLSKNITIILGGPSVSARKKLQLLQDNPDIDYFVYAQGELPFLMILQKLWYGKKIDPLSIKNCNWVDKDTNKFKTSDYEFYKIQHSPYLVSQHVLKKMLNYYLEVSDQKDMILTWETSRGCPYNCTFCDWTSGLGNKVSKRDNVYQQELELFASLNLFNLYIGDANFGIYKQDIEIVDTMVNLKKTKEYPYLLVSTNWSKTKKKIVFELIEKLMVADIITFPKISLQDIHKNVLENIERPDITWPETVEYITHIQQNFPDRHVVIELIQGLPGQTRESWEQTLAQCLGLGYARVMLHAWILIENSPAEYDKEYSTRMQLQTLSQTLHERQLQNYNKDIVVSTFSYSTVDYAYMSMLSHIASRLTDIPLSELSTLFPKFAQALKNYDGLKQVLDDIEKKFEDQSQMFLIMEQAYIKLGKMVAAQNLPNSLLRMLFYNLQKFNRNM